MTTTEDLKARLANKPGVIGATIALHSGEYFDFINPEHSEFGIEDIAWALAHVCRFGGQCNAFYSVAQHSVLVSKMVPYEHALAGLLHDAAEFVMGDMVGPLKQLCPDYKAIETRVEAEILARFGIPFPLDPCVKHADLRALRTEQRDVTNSARDSWNGLDQYEPWPHRIVPRSPAVARGMFLARYYAITEGPVA